MSSQSVYTTRRGEFRRIYRQLRLNKELFQATPIVFCEGDSWFSTPLSMNILDWLVYPAPADEKRGVAVFGQGGLFFRAEDSGDLAIDMFTAKRVKALIGWYRAFDFKAALLSGGGNDCVGTFLNKTFSGKKPITTETAYKIFLDTGRFKTILDAYTRMVGAMVDAKPSTPIIAHTYCYPIRLGTPGKLTLGNLGAAAIVKKNVGPWIGPFISDALPNLADQRTFARKIVDGFTDNVLDPLKVRFSPTFDFLDLRKEAPAEDDWFDEMHPTADTFWRLSRRFSEALRARLDLQ